MVSRVREARFIGYLVHAIYINFLRNRTSEITQDRIDLRTGGGECLRVVVEAVATVSSPASARRYFATIK